MIKVIVAGGGWAGCASALAAAKAGAQVTLLERTDMLLGTGLVGGIFRNNGRYTAAEEAIAMGGGDLFVAMDAKARHKNIIFPGHHHASLYDVTAIEPLVKGILKNYHIDICLKSRVTEVVRSGKTMQALVLDDGQELKGDVFVDATGTAGPMGNCLRYGHGCAMCVIRCPSFGPRLSLAGLCGLKEFYTQKGDGTYGAMSGSCKLNKDSLSSEIRRTLEEKGVVVVPLPEKIMKQGVLGKKACSQYALESFAKNLILLDTGHAKMMTPYFPLEDLRSIPGFEGARYEDPYAGGKGNSMRYLGMVSNDCHLKVEGMDNLFCAGEKVGPLVGHTEAIVTGLLAGHNAVRHGLDMAYLKLPSTIATGHLIEHLHDEKLDLPHLPYRCTFSGSVYFEQMKQLGLYSTDRTAIRNRVKQAGMADIYANSLI